MTVKCLVHCSGINTSTRNYKQKSGIGGKAFFTFNYHNQDDKHPNRIYFDSTPEGSLEMQIDNPEALKEFSPGYDYELILRKIDPQKAQ